MAVPQCILVACDVDKKKYVGTFSNVRPVGGFANLGRFDLWTFYYKIFMTGHYACSFLNKVVPCHCLKLTI